MQEVLYSKVSRETKTLQGISNYFNNATGEKWNAASDMAGRIVFSRYPIKWQKKIVLRVFAVLIDLPDSISSEDLFMVNIHLHWRDPAERLKEARIIANLIEEVKNGKIEGVPANSLIMVCGDFNSRLTDPPHRVISSLDPDVALEGEYKAVLKDSYPAQLGVNSKISSGSVVFEGDSETLKGGTIDFVLFQEGSLTMSNSFILNTLVLDQAVLDTYELNRNDVAKNPNQPLLGAVSFDHLPIIVDFSSSKLED